MFRIVLLSLFLCLAARADDHIVLRNGSDVSGTIVSEEGETIILRVEKPAGDMVFTYKDILAINGISADEILRVRKMTSDFAGLVTARTGMSFGGPVSRAIRTPQQLEEALTKQAAAAKEAVPTGFLAKRTLSLRFLGLVPGDFDYETQITQLPIAFSRAWFDRSQMALWLVLDRRNSPPATNEPDWGAEWFLSGIGSGEEEYDVLHEMGHYASSQLIDWEAEKSAAAGNDDAALAFEALWEGTADLVALEIIFEKANLDVAKIGGARSAVAHVPHRKALIALGAPAPYRSRVFFARDHGAEFLSQARRMKGWKVVRKALYEPPTSTEQVLHPEKYFCEKDMPIAVKLPNPGIGSWDSVDENTLGEFGTLLVLSQGNDAEAASKAAAGWGGDRWQIYRSKGGALGLAWLSAWDTEDDAKEFVGAAAKWLEKRHGGSGLIPTDEMLVGKDQGTGFFVERKGDRVLLCDGFPPELRDPLRKGLWVAEVARAAGSADIWIQAADWKAAATPVPSLNDLLKVASPAAPTGALGDKGFECAEQGFSLAAAGEWQLAAPDAEQKKRGVFVAGKVRKESASVEVTVDTVAKGTSPRLLFASFLKDQLALVADGKQMLISRAAKEVNGRPAFVVNALPSALVDGRRYCTTEFVVALDGRAVHIRFQAPNETFATLEPHFARLLEGFVAK